jgi:hypothetical protein
METAQTMQMPRTPLLLLALLAPFPLGGCGSDVTAAEEQPAEAPLDDGDVPLEWEHLAAHTARGESLSAWDGSIEGLKTLWHDNGVKSGEGEFRNNQKHGPWTFWYPSGQKRWEGTFVDDVENGEERAWHENGELSYEGRVEKGVRNGVYSFYYDNGQLWWRGPYSKGKKHGAFEYFGRDGQADPKLSGRYDHGERVSG